MSLLFRYWVKVNGEADTDRSYPSVKSHLTPHPTFFRMHDIICEGWRTQNNLTVISSVRLVPIVNSQSDESHASEWIESKNRRIYANYTRCALLCLIIFWWNVRGGGRFHCYSQEEARGSYGTNIALNRTKWLYFQCNFVLVHESTQPYDLSNFVCSFFPCHMRADQFETAIFYSDIHWMDVKFKIITISEF